MSDNVNVLIERMNHETLRKKKYLGPNADAVSMASSPSKNPSMRIKAAD